MFQSISRRGALATVALALFSVAGVAQTVEKNPKDNTVKSVTFTEAGPSLSEAQQVLKQYVGLDSRSELRVKYSNKLNTGLTVEKYSQWYNGLPVEHAAMTVVAKDGIITSLIGNVFNPAQNMSVTPALTEAQALQKALASVNAKEYMWENKPAKVAIKTDASAQYPVGTLVWVEDFNRPLYKELHLAYRFDIYAAKPMSRDLIYVDANTGNILLKDAVIKHVGATGQSIYSGNVSFETEQISPAYYELTDVNKNIITYDAQLSTNIMGAVNASNNSTTWAKSVAIDAHWGATKVYDYWMTEHSRQSWDGFGSPMQSVVNFDISYNNAFWNGFTMVYGNGSGMFNNGFEPLACLDVCAHELGHAVCQATAGLVYSQESGALNEGLSDIWGAVIENYTKPDRQMWMMGEELKTSALRSMENPKLFGNPDTYGGVNWTSQFGCSPNSGNDYCGVHNNSGVLNHWFFLLVQGGTGTNDLSNAYRVNGIGVKKAAALVYAAEQATWSSADYADFRSTTISIAQSQYGNCSREVEAVTRAWYAVGVGANYVPCAPQLSFTNRDVEVNKFVSTVACPSSLQQNVALALSGAAIGGNATFTVSAIGDNVVENVDFAILNKTITINAGSMLVAPVQLVIYDNADVTKDKVIKLYGTITQNGSNLVVGYTFDTCYVTIKGARNVPDSNGNVEYQVNTGNVSTKSVTPFFSRNSKARMQFIITAAELAAAGVRVNQPISAISFYVTQKNSTQPFNNFTLKMDHTSQNDMFTNAAAVTTQYFNGSYTTQAGWNTINLASNFTWNGANNIVVEACFSNTLTSVENDYVLAQGTATTPAYIAWDNFAATGCNINYASKGKIAVHKPVVRFTQPTVNAGIETVVAASRDWMTGPQQDVYYNNDANGKLIMNLKNPAVSLGCTKAAVTKTGKGLTFATAPYASVLRSAKEFELVAATGGNASGAYTATVYFDTSELSGVNLATVQLVSTNATTDALMTTANTEVVPGTVTYVQGGVAVKATFSGISSKKGAQGRYFLADKSFVVQPWESVAAINKNTGNFRVDNNPFSDKISVSYTLQKDTKAQVKLYDMTGKVVYAESKQLSAQQHNLVLSFNEQVLAAGNYILHITTESEVMTHKMVNQ